MIAGSNLAENFEKINNATESFESLNPAFSLVTNAACLAPFYEFLVNKGVTREGTQLISEKTLHRYTSRIVSGWNKSLSAYMVMSRGFQLGARIPTDGGTLDNALAMAVHCRP